MPFTDMKPDQFHRAETQVAATWSVEGKKCLEMRIVYTIQCLYICFWEAAYSQRGIYSMDDFCMTSNDPTLGDGRAAPRAPFCCFSGF